ncbi:MAG: aldo/keto reductase [Bryobacterales bacterium]|nr:aldo/keto reductase [Bryobacterales bacterium]
MQQGYATREGTERYAARFPRHNGFYRKIQSLRLSTLGIGTYLGAVDEPTDASYAKAVAAAVEGGINFIDTSLNYRNQHSELAVGAALEALFRTGKAQRDELMVCTKAGYLVPGAVPSGVLDPSDVVGNMHCMAPVFLEDQLERSRRNLGLETIDVFYLHNPETQLRFMGEEEFLQRTGAAFEVCERFVREGRIRYYGTATWDGYRKADQLSLANMEQAAREAGGAEHRFRFIQLPFNLAMLEAVTAGVAPYAHQLGISVIGSASLLQARLTSGLPEQLAQALAGPATDTARAIQFARSAPHIDVALIGMSKPEHVEENLGAAAYPPLPEPQFLKLFGK